MQFTKPPLTIPQQIQLLQSRGLIINDFNQATHYLSNISYYRFRAYTYPFQDNLNPNHPFNAGVSFERILDLYVFDRELRLLVLDAIERIEIALRTQIIYHYALNYGSHWYESSNLYNNTPLFHNDLNKLKKELNRSTEVFIKHYYQKYTNPLHPPAWMALGVTSLGLLSKLYENLKMSPEKKAVAQHFGLTHPYIVESWMHAFSAIRNICAHHGRLWNRQLPTSPKIPKLTLYPWLQNKSVATHKIYIPLSGMLYILNIISPGHEWKQRLKQLFLRYPTISALEMGFPANWEKEPLWQQ